MHIHNEAIDAKNDVVHHQPDEQLDQNRLPDAAAPSEDQPDEAPGLARRNFIHKIGGNGDT